MKIHRFFIIMILLSGCTIYPTQTGTTDPSTLTPSVSVTETVTENAQTNPIITISLTATASPVYVQNSCVNIVETGSLQGKGQGTIILESKKIAPDGRYENVTLKLDAETLETTNVVKGNESLFNFVASPDRNLIAYVKGATTINGSTFELIISTEDGKVVKSIFEEDGWVGMPKWANNEDILIEIFNPEKEKDESDDLVASFAKVNLFTDKIETFSITLPNKYGYLLPTWGGVTAEDFDNGFVYNRNFTHIVYVNRDGKYSLWNNQTSKVVAEFNVPGFPAPRWSPLGDRFLLQNLIDENEHELYSVDLEGNLTQLTDISSSGENYGIAEYYWSTSGRYIALWLYDKKTSRFNLAVLDTNTKEIINYCLEVTEPAPIVWSPDDSQLLVKDVYNEDHQRIFLVDLADSIAAPLIEDMEPVGWLSNP